MTDTKETDNKNTGRGTLKLKRTVDAGHVRQSVSGGRSKSVVVEKKKKRTIATPGNLAAGKAKAEPAKAKTATPAKEAKKPTKPATDEQTSQPTAGQDGQLSNLEHDARMKALKEAENWQAEEEKKKRVAEEKAKLEQEKAEQEEKQKEEERLAAEKVKSEKEAREKADSEAKSKTEQERAEIPKGKTTKRSNEAGKAPSTDDRAAAELAVAKSEAQAAGKKLQKPREEVTAARKVEVKTQKTRAERRGGGRVKGRLTINNALDSEQRERSLASLKRKREKQKAKQLGDTGPREKIIRDVVIPETITIQELANRMSERGVDVIKYLMQQGQMHKINDILDADTAELIVSEFGHNVQRVSEADVEEHFIEEDDIDEASLTSRAPVVTIMGHVDHGKTSLLDALREANVVSGEAGGITQHIGAYQVKDKDGHPITFIDTPGHEAFTAMRARGAKVTDIVILVVAADDGVMPQTIEAINHAKAAEVPIIVAINKIDKANADPSKVRTELLQHEVIVESMSGDVLEVEVSAIKRTGLDELLDAIQMQAEILELKANPDRRADGIVVEAQLERGRGPVGTVLVQRGTLKIGQIIVAGKAWGRVRALIDDHGANVVEAGPSVPVEVLGFNTAPEAGDQFSVVESEAKARDITAYRIKKRRDILAAGTGSVRTLENMMNQLSEADIKEIPVLVKGDVQGSVEAIQAALDKLGTDEVVAKVVHSGVGGITESDISLAQTTNAVVLGFNVRANIQAREAATNSNIEIRYYSVIYDLVDDIKKAMSGLLSPTIREHFLGNAEILEVFHISKVGKVAGCLVKEGKMERGAGVRLIRDNVVIHEGSLSTLKRFKDEVKEVPVGQECGMAFENHEDLKAGDVIEAFQIEEIERSL